MRDAIIQKRNLPTSIQGSELSLKISSYPITARYLAERLAKHGNTLCELCCGIGISLIEFSSYFDSIVGVDSDHEVIEHAHCNLHDAGITNCTLIVGSADNPNTLSRVTADVVAYDIPYWSDHDGTIQDKNPDLKKTVAAIQAQVTSDIVIYAPPHMSYEAVALLFGQFEYQEVWVDGKHDRNFIYLGSLIHEAGATKVALSSSS